MKTVYRYVLQQADYSELLLPRKAEILSVQWWRGEWSLWALVDPDAGHEPRVFRIVGTGHDIEPDEAACLQFVGTVTSEQHLLAFHIFELLMNTESAEAPTA